VFDQKWDVLFALSQCGLGSPEHGFPLLSGAGRLVIKDSIMAGAAVVTMADSARAYLRKSNAATPKVAAGWPGLDQDAKPRCVEALADI
jgi:hypothetical protein